MLRQRRRVRQVELAVQQAFGAVFAEVFRIHRLAVDGHQAAPDHGVPVVAANICGFQRLLEGVTLLGHDVDHKAVGRVGRGGLLPAADQIGAQKHQQHQGQQAHGQGAGLHHGIGGSGRHLTRGQHQPARGAFIVYPAPQQADGCPAEQRKQQHSSGKPTDRNHAQPGVSTDCQQQACKAADAHGQYSDRRSLEPAHIAPDHPERRHLRQLQHRRQAKSKQQGKAHPHTKHHRPHAGCRQAGLHQPRQQQHKHVVHGIAYQHTGQAGSDAHGGEFGDVAQGNVALAQSQHPQHGAGVQVLGRKAARSQGHGHCAQKCRQQRHQVEKLLGPVQRLAHLGAASFQRFDTHTPVSSQAVGTGFFQFGVGPLHIAGHCCLLTGHCQAVTHPAGGLH